MLFLCNAIVIAPSPSESRPLVHLAERVGFGHVTDSFAPRALRYLTSYFILHYGLSEEAMQRVLTQVRSSGHEETRFAPVILISDDCPVDRLLHYIQLGFDDVIALPEKRDELSARLATQLTAEQLYIQTASYFGPDRRRMELPGHAGDRRTGGGTHMRLTIQRDAESGTRVLQRQVVGQAAKRQPDPTTHYMPKPSSRRIVQ